MKKLCIPFCTLLIAGLMLGSCKRNDDDGQSATSLSAKLTSGRWQQTNYTFIYTYTSTGSTTTTEYFNAFPACIRDNITTFKADGSFSVDEGDTKCNTGDPQTYATGTWQLNPADSQFTIKMTGTVPAAYHMKALDGSTFSYEQDSTNSAFTSRTVSVYKHLP